MRRRSVIVFAILVIVVGCKKKPTPELPNVDSVSGEGGVIAQPRIGDQDQRQVTFVIDAVHEKQQPSSSPPWHAPGGEWTFFDAHLADGTKLGFGMTKQSTSDGPFAFGKGRLTVPDADNGAKLASNLASAFRGKLPPPKPRGPITSAAISLAILGTNQSRGSGGFAGSGSWTATKLFLQRPGIEAEVFFNFDLVSRHGEFAEKDSDYANDLVAFFARELRDGPPAPRTPENDPQVSAVGPKLDAWRVVQNGKSQLVRFDDGGKRIIFTAREGTATRVMRAATDDPEHAVELARIEDHFAGMQCAKSAPDTCVLTESKPTHGSDTWSSMDPETYWLVDLKTKAKRVLAPPVKEWGLNFGTPLSPDGTWIVWRETKPVAKEKQKERGVQYSVLHFAKIAGGAAKVVDDDNHSLRVVGWTGSSTTAKAVLEDGGGIAPGSKPTWSLFDPRTGTRTPIASIPDDAHDEQHDESALAPDGKHRVACTKEAIVVTDSSGSGEKRFTIHADDREAIASGEGHCVSWATPRHLKYRADRLGFIDIETMKLSYVFPPGEEPEALITFSPDLAWAAQTGSDGLRVARVVVR